MSNSMLWKNLIYGMRLAVSSDRTLAEIAPTINLLLRIDATWQRDTLLMDKATALHVIGLRDRDQAELLEMILIRIARPTIANNINVCKAMPKQFNPIWSGLFDVP